MPIPHLLQSLRVTSPMDPGSKFERARSIRGQITVLTSEPSLHRALMLKSALQFNTSVRLGPPPVRSMLSSVLKLSLTFSDGLNAGWYRRSATWDNSVTSANSSAHHTGDTSSKILIVKHSELNAGLPRQPVAQTGKSFTRLNMSRTGPAQCVSVRVTPRDYENCRTRSRRRILRWT